MVDLLQHLHLVLKVDQGIVEAAQVLALLVHHLAPLHLVKVDQEEEDVEEDVEAAAEAAEAAEAAAEAADALLKEL